MIEVERLAKTFVAGRGRRAKRVVAVEQVDFVARDGRITALLGPNGAGKTTTLRIIATLMQADAGRARVGGIDVVADPLAVRERLGVLSDARGLYTRLTARENVAYYAQLRGVPAAAFEARSAMLAELLDMQPLLDRRTAGFSTGERLKVALARALIHDPPHLVLDEPTNGLDVMSTRALRRLLLHLRDAGKCILFSTHIMQEVEQLCDEIVIVAAGRSVAHGTAAQLIAQSGQATLEDAFVSFVHKSDCGAQIAGRESSSNDRVPPDVVAASLRAAGHRAGIPSQSEIRNPNPDR
jgi:sodium transport system ATP-binding protein